MVDQIEQTKLALITLGCPKNDVDSEILAGELVRYGVELVEEAENADVILINTCGFIEDAKIESVNAILEAVELKKVDKNKKVYVWGCLSERYKGEIEKEIPEVDGFFGVLPFDEIGKQLVGRHYRWSEKAYSRRTLSTPFHSAYLKIAEGCDHLCTFCVIPLIKGSYRSRPLSRLVREVHDLVDRGVIEITLVAQDTTAYGSDCDEKTGLVQLLKKLVTIDGLQWIRIMYGHPAHITDDLIDVIAKEEKICSYLDIPLQHISNEMLQAMGRRSKRKSIEKLICRLRERIPKLGLRTTFIIGFPGETQDMFQELVDFVRTTRFERLGVFVYSAEEGTRAFRLRPSIPKPLAQERYQILMEMQREISEQNNRLLESRVLSVLVDGYDRDQSLYYGRTEWDCLDVDQTVWIRGNASAGTIIPVHIEEGHEYDLLGHTLK